MDNPMKIWLRNVVTTTMLGCLFVVAGCSSDPGPSEQGEEDAVSPSSSKVQGGGDGDPCYCEGSVKGCNDTKVFSYCSYPAEDRMKKSCATVCGDCHDSGLICPQ